MSVTDQPAGNTPAAANTDQDKPPESDDGWLTERAQEALTTIAALYEEAVSTVLAPATPPGGGAHGETGWFDPGTDAGKD
ncbi:hypothetical protein [Amycolatopsis sp. GM8]|uniref:hypothetical protein n=1 Tax=Amycolatopsis sp. GM8 TaxID=2896530 RepID=UPI001F3D00D0|nr:hypothetical protein [Amycolatopsis sp. GM8]